MSQKNNEKIIVQEHAKGNKVILFAGAHGKLRLFRTRRRCADCGKGHKKILALTEEERIRLGQNGKAYVMANHDYQKLAADFIEKLEA